MGGCASKSPVDDFSVCVFQDSEKGMRWSFVRQHAIRKEVLEKLHCRSFWDEMDPFVLPTADYVYTFANPMSEAGFA